MTAPVHVTSCLIFLAWGGTFIFLVADYFLEPRYHRNPLQTLLAIVAVTILAVVGMTLAAAAP
jgi:hypothetical protein